MKVVALFGAVSQKQLAALKKAGYTGLTTDATGEAETREAAKKAGLPLVIRPAAWSIMDHELSVEATSVGRDGEPRSYNRNGGFTRDAMIIAEAVAVVVGTGIGGTRLDLINQVVGDKPFRKLAPEPEPVDLEEVRRDLAAL